MNGFAAAIVGYICIVLDLVLREALKIGPAGSAGAAPSFVLPFVVFVALYSPQLTALWTALIMGLIIDLLTPRGAEAIVVAGPHALGFAAAAYFVLTVRSMLVRRNPLVLVVLSVVGMAIAQLVVVSLLSFRAFYPDPVTWRPLRELTDRMVASFYTAGSALVLSVVLWPLIPLMGFADPQARRGVVGGQTRRH